MKIARPREPESQFRRRRAPPPQATKFLTASLASGVIFLVLLAIVFIPRALEHGDQTPSAILTFRLGDEGRILVATAAFVLDLANFRAILLRDNVAFESLGQGLVSENATTFAFVDADIDGKLGSGDYFSVNVSPSGAYRLEVRQGTDDRLVGVWSWTGAPS